MKTVKMRVYTRELKRGANLRLEVEFKDCPSDSENHLMSPHEMRGKLRGSDLTILSHEFNTRRDPIEGEDTSCEVEQELVDIIGIHLSSGVDPKPVRLNKSWWMTSDIIFEVEKISKKGLEATYKISFMDPQGSMKGWTLNMGYVEGDENQPGGWGIESSHPPIVSYDIREMLSAMLQQAFPRLPLPLLKI